MSELLRLNVVGRVMDYIREKSSPHTGLLVSRGVPARQPAASLCGRRGGGQLVLLKLLGQLPAAAVGCRLPLVPTLPEPAIGVAAGPERLPSALLQVMLLANATISQEGAEQLLQLGQAKLAGLHCAMLLQVSCLAAAGAAAPRTAAEQGLIRHKLPAHLTTACLCSCSPSAPSRSALGSPTPLSMWPPCWST